jgi:Protein of unknown function (DUF2877)
LKNASTGNDDWISHEKNKCLLDCRWIGCRYLPQISIAAAHKCLGKVISVFDTNMNIKMINDELLVITLGKIRSPISINVFPVSNISSGFRQTVSYGSKLRKQDNETLSIGTAILININKSTIYKNNFERPCYELLKRFVNVSDKIFDTLLKTARRGCLLDPDFTTTGLLSKTLVELQHYTSIEDSKKFVEILSNSLLELCGRGPGYTPSGDDFISGYCVLFNNLSDFLHAAPVILHSKKVSRSTTWMSSKFIEYYEKGIVDEQIQEMINSIFTGDPEKYMSLLRQISYRGHTSGSDIGIGMTAALYTFIDREFHTELLSIFPRKRETKVTI